MPSLFLYAGFGLELPHRRRHFVWWIEGLGTKGRERKLYRVTNDQFNLFAREFIDDQERAGATLDASIS